MSAKNGALAPPGSACPKKATELFYMSYPKDERALLGPLLSQADTECGCVVLRSTEAMVTARLVGALDELTYWHAANNGQVCRAFVGADRQGVGHE